MSSSSNSGRCIISLKVQPNYFRKMGNGRRKLVQVLLFISVILFIALLTIFSLYQLDSLMFKSVDKIKDFIAGSELVRERFIKKRETFLKFKEMSEVNPWDPTTGMYFWDYFPPTLTCPYTLERIGRPGDGGKWVCGFELLEKNFRKRDDPCIVYSFGVGPDSSFETEILERTDCVIYAYDYTVQGTKINTALYPETRVKFIKQGLGKNSKINPPLKTLREFMNENGHYSIDLLKVDIEGGEFETFTQIMDDFDILPFKHLNLEVHIQDFNGSAGGGKQLDTFHDWWNRLESKGLRAFSWEVNHHPCSVLKSKPTAHEYSFINIKKLLV